MDERVQQFRVGAVALATLILAGVLVLLFGRLPGLGPPKKNIYITFTQAPGVTVDTPVQKFGKVIGRVTDVEFADDAGLLVTAAVDDNVKLYSNEVCQVSSSLLGGDAVIQFIPAANKDAPKKLLEAGDRIVGVAASDPTQAIANLETTLAQAVTSVAATSDEIGKLARRVTDILENNDDQIARVATKAEDTLNHLQSIARNTDEVLGDPQARDTLKRALIDLPEVLKDTRQAVSAFKTTLDSADRNLQNIEGLTKPLGQRGAQLVESIEGTARKLDAVLTDLSTFSASINNPEGSVGKLLSDPQLYRRVTSAVENIETVTRELRPILRDARSFSDKIARHPELLGVRGAIRPSSGAK